MTDEKYRNRGLIRQIMEEIDKDYSEIVDGIFLFANDEVLDFYPKFGFQKSGEYETEEGCLSLLGGPRKTRRYQKIKVRYQNLQLQTRLQSFSGWTAQIIQHEIDHCNGILI